MSDLERAVNEAGATVESESATRLFDKLLGEGVVASVSPHDDALDDLGLVDVIVWPNGEVSEVRAGFVKRIAPDEV